MYPHVYVLIYLLLLYRFKRNETKFILKKQSKFDVKDAVKDFFSCNAKDV